VTSTPFVILATPPPPEPTVFLLLIDLARGSISVRGELDRANVDRLEDAVDVLRSSPAPRWSIDAAGITFCDAGGLRGLIHAQQKAALAGRTLVVTRPSRMLARLLALATPERPEAAPADRTV